MSRLHEYKKGRVKEQERIKELEKEQNKEKEFFDKIGAEMGL